MGITLSLYTNIHQQKSLNKTKQTGVKFGILKELSYLSNRASFNGMTVLGFESVHSTKNGILAFALLFKLLVGLDSIIEYTQIMINIDLLIQKEFFFLTLTENIEYIILNLIITIKVIHIY